MNVRLSFVIPTCGRPERLRECLESLERAGIEGRGEAWIGFDGDPQAPELSREILKRHPWARVLILERVGRAEARNRLIAGAAGELVYLLDDDASVPEGFVSRVLEAFDRNPSAPVVGGPNIGPAGAGPLQRAVDFLLRSPLGAGPMRVRYRRAGVERPLPGWCFMLSNFGVRREVFEKHGFRFPARCHSAEENLFLFQVEAALGRAVFSPDLYVFHHRRPTVASFCSQVFTNGRGRAQITLAAPRSLQPAVLAPCLFALWLAAAVVAGRPWLWLPAAAYAAAAVFEAARLAAVERDFAAAARLPPLFALAHLSYAAGLAAGAFSGRAVHAGAMPGYPRDIRPARVGLDRDA